MNQPKYPFLIAFIVLVAGSLVIFMTQPKRGDCDIFLENIRQQLKYEIYGQKRGSVNYPPTLLKSIEDCRLGNTPGSCLKMRDIVIKVNEAINRFPEACISVLGEEQAMLGAFKQVLQVWIEIAWGETPPQRGMFCGEGCWFEVADLALFCRWKETAARLFGPESIQSWEPALLSNLLYDRAIWENDRCTNCDKRRKALEVVGLSEVRSRSLLALNCQRF